MFACHLDTDEAHLHAAGFKPHHVKVDFGVTCNWKDIRKEKRAHRQHVEATDQNNLLEETIRPLQMIRERWQELQGVEGRE